MTMYTCPMHPEVEQEKPGKCPLCNMKLVAKNNTPLKEEDKTSYASLVIIISLIIGVSLVTAVSSGFSFTKIMYFFMIGFFLVFSGFKLLDIRGFAEGYATYDLLAKRIFGYGFLYPFIELFFALAMILGFQIRVVLIAEVIVMAFSGLGVAIKLAKHEKFHCACLGTFLKVPLTKVTLI